VKIRLRESARDQQEALRVNPNELVELEWRKANLGG
jgi:hypothetical protein